MKTMQLIKAPSLDAPQFASVFLAGGISNCPDWQTEITHLFETYPITIFNPRRDIFPNEISEETKQIQWEFERLRSADLIAFWFPKETLNPITLFELGAAMERKSNIVIGVQDGYSRILDLQVQIKLCRPEITLLSSLDEVAKAITHALTMS
jgi:hypothetical protein